MVQAVAEMFKGIADSGWCVISSGDVSSPIGRFAVVEIPEESGARQRVRQSLPDKERAAIFDSIETGWYFVLEHPEQGIIYDRCKNKDYAFARFTLSRSAYEEWTES